MVGRNPLWVARQHGHSITTMLRVYAAWTEGAIEADIKAIKRAMGFGSRVAGAASSGLRAAEKPLPAERLLLQRTPPSFGSGFGSRHRRVSAKCSKRRVLNGGERDPHRKRKQLILRGPSYLPEFPYHQKYQLEFGARNRQGEGCPAQRSRQLPCSCEMSCTVGGFVSVSGTRTDSFNSWLVFSDTA